MIVIIIIAVNNKNNNNFTVTVNCTQKKCSLGDHKRFPKTSLKQANREDFCKTIPCIN